MNNEFGFQVLFPATQVIQYWLGRTEKGASTIFVVFTKKHKCKDRAVGGALTLGKRAPPTYAPSRMRTEKKEECVLTARMLPECRASLQSL